MAPSLSQMSNTSTGSQAGIGGLMGASPANLLSFTSPAGLTGLDLNTPSALLNDPNLAAQVGGQSMNISLSDLGISSRRGNEDEDRRVKMENVLAKLQGRKRGRTDASDPHKFGRLSEEGVRRVSSWVGMEFDADKKDARHEGNRQISIAGKKAVVVDVSFKNNLPAKVDVSFFSEDSAVTAHQEAAAQVLLDDLTPPPGVAAINTKLDAFAANLETIAKLDKLSAAGQTDCFEAIAGLYTSLKKLYEHEKAAALALSEVLGTEKEERVAREVLSKKSGRPQMHARRKIGLSVEYWVESNDSRCRAGPGNGPQRREAETSSTPSGGSSKHKDQERLFALYLTAEPSDPNLYPSLRVSSSWLGDRVHVPASETTSPSALLTGDPSIDWQEPSPTYVPSDEASAGDAMDLDGSAGQAGNTQQKLPNARFVAKLDPPLAMPWTIANQVLQSVGAQAGMDVDALSTYNNVLLHRATNANTSVLGLANIEIASAVASSTKTLLNRAKDGTEAEIQHQYELWIPGQEFGYVLRSIPFSHPRQIVQVLPVLRQWAALGSLLQNAFLPLRDLPNPGRNAAGTGSGEAGAERQDRKKFSLAELLTPPRSPHEDAGGDVDMTGTEPAENATVCGGGGGGVLPVDISLTTTPTPTLDIMFPLARVETGLGWVSVGILGDGDVTILGQNLIEANKDGDGLDDAQLKRMARALEVVGDVGVWVEWLAREFG